MVHNSVLMKSQIKLVFSILGEKVFAAFSSSITDKIDHMHGQGADTQYLVEVKKGLLALGDFFKILDNADVLQVMPSLGNLNDIAKPIREGIFECMSVTEKAQLELLSASGAFSKNIGVTVTRDGNASVISDVINIDVAPTVSGKAEWLNDTLRDSDNALQLKSNSPVKLCA